MSPLIICLSFGFIGVLVLGLVRLVVRQEYGSRIGWVLLGLFPSMGLGLALYFRCKESSSWNEERRRAKPGEWG